MFIKKLWKFQNFLSDCQAVDRYTNKYQHLNINKIINKLFVREAGYGCICSVHGHKYVNVGRIAATKSMLIKG